MTDNADTEMESLGGNRDSRDGGIVWTSTQTGTETINDILEYSISKFYFGCSVDENTRDSRKLLGGEQSALNPLAGQKSLYRFLPNNNR